MAGSERWKVNQGRRGLEKDRCLLISRDGRGGIGLLAMLHEHRDGDKSQVLIASGDFIY